MIVSCLVLCCLCIASDVPGETTVPPAATELSGLVLGPNETGLPGARVSLRSTTTGKTWFGIAGAKGLYRISNLPVDSYELKVELEGFDPAVIPEVRLPEGASRSIDVKLEIATLREIVTVVGTAPRESVEAVEIRKSSARDVGEALSETAGVTKLRKGGIANDIVLRGFQSKDLNVLIDGQRVYGACPNHMDPPAFHVDFAEVDRIEMGKGPFDVKNNGSLGGVVNIVTRKPAKGLHGSASLSAGGFGFLSPSGTGSYAGDHFSALAGYSYRSSNPYQDGAGNSFTNYTNYRAGVQDSDAFRVGTAWAGISLVPGRNQLLQIAYTRQEADHVLYPYLQMDAIYDNTDRANFGYQVDGLTGRIDSIRIQGYFTGVRHWMTDAYRTSSVKMPRDYSMGTFAVTKTLGGKVEFGLKDLTLGFEGFNRYWNGSTQMAGMGYASQSSIPDVSTVSLGIYAEYTRAVTERVKLDAGARVDRTRSEADPLKANTNLYFAYNSTRDTSAVDVYPSGALRLTYTMPLGLEFSGGAGRTVRVPDATERYFALRRAGSDWVGNPELRPSSNAGFDGTVSLRRKALYASSTFYWNRVNDFITVRKAVRLSPVPGVMNTGARSYENVDATLYGTEIQLVYSLTRQLFLSDSFAYTRASQDPRPERNIFSEYLAEIPPMLTRPALRFDTGRFSAELEGVFAGAQRRVDTDLREEPTPGYGIANVRVAACVRDFRLTVGVNNIFDRLFREHLSFQRDPFRTGVRVFEPGRNLFANLTYRF